MKTKALYLVKETIPYEGINVWIVACDNETEAVSLVKKDYDVCTWKVDTFKLSNTSDYTENEIIRSIL
jgi:hypothetical protein